MDRPMPHDCERSSTSRRLLLEIAHCRNIDLCLRSGDSSHPCYEIVRSQRVDRASDFQCPEPWNGRIETAPILFISSNPSISDIEQHPTLTWSDQGIVDYFSNRFGHGHKLWIKDGRYTLLNDDSYSGSVAFLASVRQRAAELLDRPAADVMPGVDYALAEIVRCKSRSETGVSAAAAECSSRYLRQTMEVSGAKLMACLGKTAERAMREFIGVDSKERVIGPVDVGGRPRLVAFLPHPNSRGVSTFRTFMPEALEQLRVVLTS